MEKIYFSDRANWYTEETYSVEQNEFLKIFSEMNNIKYPIIIPCNSGKNLEALSKVASFVLGYDIDEKMIISSNDEIRKKELYNCKVEFGNLLKFNIPPHTDSVFILNEAIHMFNPKSTTFIQVLENILRKLDGFLILETFDYKNTNTDEKLRYFCGSELNKIIKDFTLEKDGVNISRYHQALLSTEGVIIRYYYRFIDTLIGYKKWSKSEMELFFFDYDGLQCVVDINGGKIESVFSSYSMEYKQDSAKKIYVIRCFGGNYD